MVVHWWILAQISCAKMSSSRGANGCGGYPSALPLAAEGMTPPGVRGGGSYSSGLLFPAVPDMQTAGTPMSTRFILIIQKVINITRSKALLCGQEQVPKLLHPTDFTRSDWHREPHKNCVTATAASSPVKDTNMRGCVMYL